MTTALAYKHGSQIILLSDSRATQGGAIIDDDTTKICVGPSILTAFAGHYHNHDILYKTILNKTRGRYIDPDTLFTQILPTKIPQNLHYDNEYLVAYEGDIWDVEIETVDGVLNYVARREFKLGLIGSGAMAARTYLYGLDRPGHLYEVEDLIKAMKVASSIDVYTNNNIKGWILNCITNTTIKLL